MNEEVHKEFLELCRLVDSHKVISFDIYDTALLRNVLYPTDIFDIVNLELNKENIKVRNFKKVRINAEQKARKISKNEDVSLDEIYQVISDEIGENLSRKIKKIELCVESKFTISNSFMKKVYEYAISRDKKIIFISDMYLPKEFIAKLLAANGYHIYEEIFVSGSIGISKASTKLFYHVREQLKIDTKWLHIGDNEISDYENAIKCQIDAFYYIDIKKRAGISNYRNNISIQKSILKAIQINNCYTNYELNYWQRFGISIVSSIFWGFTLWLINELKGKDNVYFLSRDGYLPFKLYEKIVANVKGFKEYPKPTYLFASRKAYQITNIINMEQSDALILLTTYNAALGQKLNLSEIFDNLGLEEKKYSKIIKQFGFSGFHETINSEEDRIKTKKLLQFLYSSIIANLKKEKMFLEEYFKQNGLYEVDEINIVDIGWSGSTHKAIADITQKPTKGYYFGTHDSVYPSIVDKVNGYAFNLGKPYKNMKKIIENVMMYEFVFSAPHGTLLRFDKSGNDIYPILKNVENNDLLYGALKFIHTSVLEITDKYLPYYTYLEKIDLRDCLEDYFTFIEARKYSDLIEFSNLSAVVGIGNSQHTQHYVTSTSIEDYYLNRKKVEENISKNLWKNALILHGSLDDLRKNLGKKQSTFRIDSTWLNKEKIKKGLKNPKKAVKYIIKEVKKRI